MFVPEYLHGGVILGGVGRSQGNIELILLTHTPGTGGWALSVTTYDGNARGAGQWET